MNIQAEDLFRLAALPPVELRALVETVSGTSVPDPKAGVTALRYDPSSPVTAGLWRVEVTSPQRGDAPSCVFFVKLVRHTRLWPGLRRLPDDAARAEFIGFYPWQYELDIQEALRRAGDERLPADMAALGVRLPGILDLLDEPPQTYAHGDASPQNLLLPADEPGVIVVIDWGFGTLLPVGFDLGQLLVGLAHAGLTDPAALPAIDAEIFPAYLAGLAAEDYPVDQAQVRVGYLGSLAARSALCAIPFEALEDASPDEPTVTMFARRIKLTRAMLDLADGGIP